MEITQVSVFVENRKGSIAELTSLLGGAGYNIYALAIAETDNFGVCRMIIDRPKDAFELLKSSGYTVRLVDVLAVRVPDRPNGLADVLEIIEKEDISVEYLYSFLRNSGFDALIVFKLSDNRLAEIALRENYIQVVSPGEVHSL